MAENELTPVTRKELFYDQIIQNAGGGGGGSTTIVPLAVDHNDTFTAPAGTAYSPVTVNVPTTGDYTTYVKTASSPEEVSISAEEAEILAGSFLSISVGSVAKFSARFSQDTETTYIIHGIGYWLLVTFAFGVWYVNTSTSATTQECYSWPINSANAPSSYSFSGSTTLTFYVTSTQKQALDAL